MIYYELGLDLRDGVVEADHGTGNNDDIHYLRRRKILQSFFELIWNLNSFAQKLSWYNGKENILGESTSIRLKLHKS